MILHCCSGWPYSSPRHRGCGEELDRKSLTLLSKLTIREEEEKGGWGHAPASLVYRTLPFEQ